MESYPWAYFISLIGFAVTFFFLLLLNFAVKKLNESRLETKLLILQQKANKKLSSQNISILNVSTKNPATNLMGNQNSTQSKNSQGISFVFSKEENTGRIFLKEESIVPSQTSVIQRVAEEADYISSQPTTSTKENNFIIHLKNNNNKLNEIRKMEFKEELNANKATEKEKEEVLHQNIKSEEHLPKQNVSDHCWCSNKYDDFFNDDQAKKASPNLANDNRKTLSKIEETRIAVKYGVDTIERKNIKGNKSNQIDQNEQKYIDNESDKTLLNIKESIAAEYGNNTVERENKQGNKSYHKTTEKEIEKVPSQYRNKEEHLPKQNVSDHCWCSNKYDDDFLNDNQANKTSSILKNGNGKILSNFKERRIAVKYGNDTVERENIKGNKSNQIDQEEQKFISEPKIGIGNISLDNNNKIFQIEMGNKISENEQKHQTESKYEKMLSSSKQINNKTKYLPRCMEVSGESNNKDDKGFCKISKEGTLCHCLHPCTSEDLPPADTLAANPEEDEEINNLKNLISYSKQLEIKISEQSRKPIDSEVKSKTEKKDSLESIIASSEKVLSDFVKLEEETKGETSTNERKEEK